MADFDAIEQSLITHKGVLEEQKKRKIVEERRDAFSQVDSGIKLTLHRLRSEYSQLKALFLGEQYKLHVLHSIDQDKQPCRQKSEAKLTQITSTLSEVKDQLNTSRENVEQLAESSQTLFDEFQTLNQRLETVIDESDKKKARILGVYDQLKGDLAKGYQSQIDGAESRLQRLVQNLKNTEALLAEVDKQMGSLRQNRAALQDGLKDARDINHSLKGARLKMKWCVDCLLALSKVSGVREKSIEGNTWTVEIFNPNHGSESPTMALSITFGPCVGGTYYMERIECHSKTLDLRAIIRQAKERNDIHFLLTEARALWHHELPLMEEIEMLRKRYAVDWMKEKNTLRALFGRAVPMICYLRVEPGYPRTGGVILEKINDITRGEKLDKIKPASDNPGLAEWLELLHEKMTASFNGGS